MFGCSNISGRDRSQADEAISYHKFPTSKLRRTWVQKINRKNWTPTNYSVVCSLHFRTEDFELDMYARIMGTKPRRKLKHGAIPSLCLRGENISQHSTNASASQERRSLYLSRRQVLEENECVQNLLNSTANSNQSAEAETKACDKAVQIRPFAFDFSAQTPRPPSTASVSVQANLCCSLNDCACESDNSSISSQVTDDDMFSPSDSQESDVEDAGHAATSPASPQVILAFANKISELLKFCPSCGSPVEEEYVRVNFDAGLMYVSLICLQGCNYTWTSQPTMSMQRCRSGSADFQLAASFVLCGGTYALLKAVADCMQMGVVSAQTYYKIQRECIAPVVFSTWSAQQHVILQDLSEKATVRLAGDARCDSPGFSAKYSTYTLMDYDSGYVVCGRVVQLGQEENSSVGMEKVGLKSCLEKVLSHEVPVSVLTTDRSPSVIKMMKTDFPEIDHQFDIWHLAKSIKKNILSASKKKSTAVLNDWLRSIINHLYFCAQSCDGNAEKLIELWLSELNHICGVHRWQQSSRFQTVVSCLHEEMDEELRAQGLEKKYLDPCSDAFKALENVVASPSLLAALRHCTLALSTAPLENLHSVMLKHTPKRLHFGSTAMNLRTCLAFLDHNYSIEKKIKQKSFKYQYSKVSGRWVARRTYSVKEYSWRQDLLNRVVVIRESGVSPPDCNAPFFYIPIPRNVAPVPMPSKAQLRASRKENTRHVQ